MTSRERLTIPELHSKIDAYLATCSKGTTVDIARFLLEEFLLVPITSEERSAYPVKIDDEGDIAIGSHEYYYPNDVEDAWYNLVIQGDKFTATLRAAKLSAERQESKEYLQELAVKLYNDFYSTVPNYRHLNYFSEIPNQFRRQFMTMAESALTHFEDNPPSAPETPPTPEFSKTAPTSPFEKSNNDPYPAPY